MEEPTVAVAITTAGAGAITIAVAGNSSIVSREETAIASVLEKNQKLH